MPDDALVRIDDQDAGPRAPGWAHGRAPCLARGRQAERTPDLEAGIHQDRKRQPEPRAGREVDGSRFGGDRENLGAQDAEFVVQVAKPGKIAGRAGRARRGTDQENAGPSGIGVQGQIEALALRIEQAQVRHPVAHLETGKLG